MNKCLVTKLKAVIDNPNLPKAVIISDDTRNFCSNYSTIDEDKMYFVQEFLDRISAFQDKLFYITFPLLAINTMEALYDYKTRRVINFKHPAIGTDRFDVENHAILINQEPSWEYAALQVTPPDGSIKSKYCSALIYKNKVESVMTLAIRGIDTEVSYAITHLQETEKLPNIFVGVRNYATVYSNTKSTTISVDNNNWGTFFTYGQSTADNSRIQMCVLGLDLLEDEYNVLRTAMIDFANRIMEMSL